MKRRGSTEEAARSKPFHPTPALDVLSLHRLAAVLPLRVDETEREHGGAAA